MDRISKENFIKVVGDFTHNAKCEYVFDFCGSLCRRVIDDTKTTTDRCLCRHTNEMICNASCQLMSVQLIRCNDQSCKDNPRYLTDTSQASILENDTKILHRHEYEITLCNGRTLRNIVQYQPEQ